MGKGLNNRNFISELLYMSPVFVFALSILLVRLHLFSMPMTDVYWTEATDTTTLSDLFNYYKAIAIITAAVLAIIVFIVGYFKDKIVLKKSRIYIPILAYIFFVLISLFFSNYKYFALRGMNEHFEGTVVLLSYMIMLIFVANAIDSERRLKYVSYCVLGIAFLLSVLGITQATGHDFFSTVVGQKIMTPNYVLENGVNSWDMIDIMASSGQAAYDFSFTEGEVYQTVYNINYVPLYLSLLIPVSALLFVFSWTNDNRIVKGFSLVPLLLYGLYLYNFFTANSASGYIGLAAVFVVALIVFRKYIKIWAKPIILLIIVLSLIMGITVDRWLPEVKAILSSTRELLVDYIYSDSSVSMEYDFPAGSKWAAVNYIETHDGYMIFSVNDAVIRIERDDEHKSFAILDGERNQLYLRELTNSEGSGEFEILDDRFHDYVTLSLQKRDDVTYVVITTMGTDWLFSYKDGQFLYRNLVGKDIQLSNIPHNGIFGNYKNGHGRALIWATTIPLLKNYIIKGAGADSFAFVYPQNDYATLYTVTRSASMTLVTDKAHNIYMQYWVNTGFLSLVAWLCLIAWYLIGAFKTFANHGFKDLPSFINGGIFCGIIGFMVIALFNDGSVNTMPMFYLMLGLGFAINLKDQWQPIVSTSESPMHMPEI